MASWRKACEDAEGDEPDGRDDQIDRKLPERRTIKDLLVPPRTRIGLATDPAQIPHDIENRPATTETNRELKQQVIHRFPPIPQVGDLARTTLSRWRHGFEPRWDYEHKGPGQGASLKAFGGLNRDSNSEYPENIPSRIERSEVRESPRVEGGCTGATASWHPTIAPFSAEQTVTG